MRDSSVLLKRTSPSWELTGLSEKRDSHPRLDWKVQRAPPGGFPGSEVPRRGRIQGRHVYPDLSFIFCSLGLWVSDLLSETLPGGGVPSSVALCPRSAPGEPCPVCSSPSVRGPEGSSLGGGWGKAPRCPGKGQAPVAAQGRESPSRPDAIAGLPGFPRDWWDVFF